MRGKGDFVSLLSSQDVIVSIGTPRLELLQPLDRRSLPLGHGGGGGDEEQEGQQGQRENEPLGIHDGGDVKAKGRGT